MLLNIKFILKSQNIPTDLKGPKVKYNLHYGDVRGDILRPPHDKTPASVIANKNTKIRSIESFENVQKAEDVSYCAISYIDS